MDLFELILHLRPLPAPDPTALIPDWWGRAAHHLLLSVVSQSAPALADELHSGNGPRPFSTSSLFGRFPHGALDPQTPYRLRLTSLTAELSSLLFQAALDGPLSPGSVVELDRHEFEVLSVSGDEADQAPVAPLSYADLSARHLLAKQPAPRRIGFRLLSPTTFKSGGRHLPIPLPDLAFGSLLERWNAFAPVDFPPELRRYAAECLAVGRYKLHTRAVPWKSGALRVGALGEVTYVTLNYDRYWMSLLAALADFAAFAGLGAGVSTGLGQCRRST